MRADSSDADCFFWSIPSDRLIERFKGDLDRPTDRPTARDRPGESDFNLNSRYKSCLELSYRKRRRGARRQLRKCSSPALSCQPASPAKALSMKALPARLKFKRSLLPSAARERRWTASCSFLGLWTIYASREKAARALSYRAEGRPP